MKKNKIKSNKRGDTWVGLRPCIIPDKKKEKRRKECRNKVTNW